MSGSENFIKNLVSFPTSCNKKRLNSSVNLRRLTEEHPRADLAGILLQAS